MNFVVQNGTVLFRTSLHSRLGRQVSLGVAAFQVDEIDDYTESGWSVLLRGAVEPVETRDLPPAAARPLDRLRGRPGNGRSTCDCDPGSSPAVDWSRPEDGTFFPRVHASRHCEGTRSARDSRGATTEPPPRRPGRGGKP